MSITHALIFVDQSPYCRSVCGKISEFTVIIEKEWKMNGEALECIEVYEYFNDLPQFVTCQECKEAPGYPFWLLTQTDL